MSFAQDYLKTAIGGMGIQIDTKGTVEEDIIRITINSERNAVKSAVVVQVENENRKYVTTVDP